MYLNEPTAGLSSNSDPELILGGKFFIITKYCLYGKTLLVFFVVLYVGESCMWGETVDPSDLQATVWPRAAAVAEVLWSPFDYIYPNGGGASIDLSIVESRLETFRCRLTQRGIGAAPVKNKRARYQPPEPGSFYVQRRI